jgi:hypothetical protein
VSSDTRVSGGSAMRSLGEGYRAGHRRFTRQTL